MSQWSSVRRVPPPAPRASPPPLPPPPSSAPLDMDHSPPLSKASNGLSCRDIKEVCEHAERRWVAKMIKKEVTDDTPPLSEYMLCLSHRRREAGPGVEVSTPFQRENPF